MAKKKKKTLESTSAKREFGSGKYVFDSELGRLVKISDKIPGVSSKSAKSGEDPGPCGQGGCGSCPMKDG